MPRSSASDPVVRVMIVDDDAQSLTLNAAAVEGPGLEIITMEHPEEALRRARTDHPSIALLELRLPGMNGIELMERLIAMDPSIDVILITAHYSTESAVEAIQKGACDYFNKPLGVEKLRRRISQLLSDAETRRKTHELEEEILNACQFEGIVGRSPLMLDVFAKVRRV